jgi:hypothetical protein
MVKADGYSPVESTRFRFVLSDTTLSVHFATFFFQQYKKLSLQKNWVCSVFQALLSPKNQNRMNGCDGKQPAGTVKKSKLPDTAKFRLL